MKKSQTPISICFVFLLAAQMQPALCANEQLEAGKKKFASGNFKGALINFQNASAADPGDANALYYCAITAHQLGQLKVAEKAYGKLVVSYPGTQASLRAVAALKYLDPDYLSRVLTRLPGDVGEPGSGGAAGSARRSAYVRSSSPTSRSGGGGGGDLDKLPAQSRVYFENSGNNLVVDVYINNRPIKMFFDSGASDIALGKNHLRELGIAPPEGPPVGASRGVGDGGAQATWAMKVNVKVGQIERTNFPITVQENMPTEHPLLGQTFFRDFHYTIDNAGKSILFTKTGSETGVIANANNSVPFHNEGRAVIVSVEVNGRPIAMYFDTGAEYCTLSFSQLTQLGIEIPDDARQTISTGIAGQSKSLMFMVPRMKLGPIEKQNVTIMASGDELPHPLLGQSFFGDLRYEFDNQNHVLMIRR
jgi:clan AA aspartic protease (TIGR02281 family)